jgi:hypothetical protein
MPAVGFGSIAAFDGAVCEIWSKDSPLQRVAVGSASQARDALIPEAGQLISRGAASWSYGPGETPVRSDHHRLH